MDIIIKEINNVVPYKFDEDEPNKLIPSYDESNSTHTCIICTDQHDNRLNIIVDNSTCKNSYLLADAIKDTL